MNPISSVLNEDFTTSPDPETASDHNELSETNIISLAEEGLLSPSATSRRENASYHDYSPLNEW